VKGASSTFAEIHNWFLPYSGSWWITWIVFVLIFKIKILEKVGMVRYSLGRGSQPNELPALSRRPIRIARAWWLMVSDSITYISQKLWLNSDESMCVEFSSLRRIKLFRSLKSHPFLLRIHLSNKDREITLSKCQDERHCIWVWVYVRSEVAAIIY